LFRPRQSDAQVSLLRGPVPPTPQGQISLTVEVADVDETHAKAVASGIPIIYPLVFGLQRESGYATHKPTMSMFHKMTRISRMKGTTGKRYGLVAF
jgi:hypothetical protein